MFNFFKKKSPDDPWKEFGNSMDNTSDKKIFANIVDQFFIPDEIDLKKFIANYQIIVHNSRESYKLMAEVSNIPDYSEYGTPSIDIFASILNQPLGYPKWFIASYPDVVNFFNNLEDGDEKLAVFENLSEEEIFDNEHKFKLKYLRKFIEIFKNSGNKTECSY